MAEPRHQAATLTKTVSPIPLSFRILWVCNLLWLNEKVLPLKPRTVLVVRLSVYARFVGVLSARPKCRRTAGRHGGVTVGHLPSRRPQLPAELFPSSLRDTGEHQVSRRLGGAARAA